MEIDILVPITAELSFSPQPSQVFFFFSHLGNFVLQHLMSPLLRKLLLLFQDGFPDEASSDMVVFALS